MADTTNLAAPVPAASRGDLGDSGDSGDNSGAQPGGAQLDFELGKSGDDCSNYPSAVAMCISLPTLPLVALARRLVHGLDEAVAAGASMTIALGNSATFTDDGEPWPEAGADDDGSDLFAPASFWLTVDRFGLALEIWERHSGTTLNGSLAWCEIGEFASELDRHDAAAAERLIALAAAPLGGQIPVPADRQRGG